jgi:tetratricopeptide (TPR) repeat protein
MSRDPHNHDPGDANLDRLLTMADTPPQLGPEARARLLARLQRSVAGPAQAPPAAPGAPLRMPPRTSPLKIAAYALAVAAAGALVWTGVNLLGRAPDGSVPGDRLAEHRNDGERPLRVTLADGSTAILRAGAHLRETGPRGLELLAGEVLLDVVPGEGTFTVEAAAGQVEVRGTKFLLRQLADSRELVAGVLRGEVRLLNGQGEAVLQAGESGGLSEGTAPAKRASERLSHEVEWARDAIVDPSDERKAVRRGNLLARFPNWPGEFPLPVRTMDVDVVVENGIARTTIDQTFFNQTDYELEGVYSFPLPPDAAIARLAMYVDGKLMEAGITERQEGREIYESIVYRRRDPALLEWMQGNEFRVRIYPLPARTEKRILLSYTEPLASLYGDYSVRVPIPELDHPVGTLRYRVHVKDRTLSLDSCCVDFTVSDRGDERLAEATLHDVAIGEDLALTLYPTSKPPEVTTAAQPDPGGDYFMVRARPSLARSSQHTPRRWVVLHDTSASRSPAELAAQTRFLRHLLGELDEADRVSVLAFDSTLRALPGGFARVDALDPTAVAEFLARAGRDHVGATELARAVDHALGLLAEDAGPEAPHILYVGDGLASDRSDAGRAGLRDRLAGKATFVAATVGDEVDASLLADLAGATGGLRVHVTAGADLRWQALDLAAALNTPRLQGLRARLLGPGGAPVDARTHLSASSLADGEALVLLSRRTGPPGPVPKTLVLEGTLDGAPWTQRWDLPAPAASAGYLPRLWARAQIEADLRAGAEAHKQEITALGLEHFLVTPFTSLLVLENEAMYRQYKVRRPTAKDWAHYDAPAEIKVVREPLGSAEPAPGTIVQRLPIELIGDGGRRRLRGRWDAEDDVWGALTGTESGWSFGVGGLGLSGTGRGGGGVGGATIGLGSTGLIGKGSGTGSGYGRGAGAGFGGRGTRVPTVRQGQMSLGGEASAGPVLSDARFVTTKELRRSATWSRDDSPAAEPAPDVATDRLAGGFAPAFGERRAHTGFLDGRGYPAALQNTSDVRLGDLGEHLPALFEDGFDRERERLLATAAGVAPGTISADARELVVAARARVAPASYRVDGGVLRLDGASRFTRSRSVGNYLREVVVYDGERLVATYPDQDLAVERRVGATEPALLSQWVPWLLPDPDALARWYEVTRVGERTLRLAPRGAEDRIDLELDAELRLVAVRHTRGAERVGVLAFEYDAAGLTIVRDRQRTRVERSDAAPDLAPAAATTLQLPLRGDADLAAALAAEAPGGPAWRAVQRQRLAVFAALSQHARLVEVLRELLAHGPLTRGELVLAGAGVLAAPAELADKLLAGRKDDPVAAYLGALRKLGRGNNTGPLEQVAKDSEGTLVGLLAAHTRVLADAARGASPAALTRLRAYLDAYDHPELAYIATHRLAGNYNWRRPEAPAPVWEALAAAEPRWRAAALHAAGTAWWYAGKRPQASDCFERALAAAAEDGQLPTIDWTVRAAVTQSRGQAGWRLQWNRWRAAVQRSGDAVQLVAFLTAAQQLGEPGEIHRVLVGADLSRLDADAGAALVAQLLAAGQTGDAQQVLRGLLAASPDAPDLLDLAALVAERQGRLAEAAGLAERALAGRGELELHRLRAAYRRLFDLRARLAESITEPDPKDMSEKPARDPVDLALDVAARWRAEDPDNQEIDERCATLLFTLGHREEAVRHLDSIVERHPAEGSAYAAVAGILEREGRFAEADLRWQQAIAVEPTDPTWRVGRAHNLIATGDTAGALALAQQVKAGKWHERFFQAVEDGKELVRQLDAP